MIKLWTLKNSFFFSFSLPILLLQIRPNPLRKNKEKNPRFSAERAQNHRTHFDLEALSQEREQYWAVTLQQRSWLMNRKRKWKWKNPKHEWVKKNEKDSEWVCLFCFFVFLKERVSECYELETVMGWGNKIESIFLFANAIAIARIPTNFLSGGLGFFIIFFGAFTTLSLWLMRNDKLAQLIHWWIMIMIIRWDERERAIKIIG